MAKINAINNQSEELTIDPGASGDSFIQFDINATGEFRIGVDDDAADAFKISQGSALGSNDTFVVTAGGNITKPLTSCFSAHAAAQTGVTGDGTVYTITFTGGEYFDQNSNFASPSFTAPVTGKYLLTTAINSSDWAAAHTRYQLRIVTSNRTYYTRFIDPGNVFDANTDYGTSTCIIADMDASDTATIAIYGDNGAKVVDIEATDSIFTGCLVA